MSDRVAHHVNPRGQAVKSTEMTVRRALALIEVFDNLPDGAKDWQDADPKDLRKAMGDDQFDPRQAVYPELWERYKDGSLHEQVIALADNLVLEDLSKKARKEIEDGLNRITKE